MSHHQSKAELRNGVEMVAAECGGLLTVDAVRTSDLPHLLAAAAHGDRAAVALVRPTMETMQRVASAPKKRPVLCASCPRPVRPGDKFSVAIARAAIDAPTAGLGLVICRRCGPTRGAIRASAAVGLRGLFPEARDLGNIDLTQNGGRA